MLELRCGDVVGGCPGVVTGESEEEILAQAASHAAQEHGLTQIDDGTRAVLIGAIHAI